MAKGIDVVRKYDLPAAELEEKVEEAFAQLSSLWGETPGPENI